MTSILCLAHFCEVHGPTPLMVTEGIPVKCNTCCDRGNVPDIISAVTAAAAAAANQAVSAGAVSDASSAHEAATAAVATAIQKMKLSSRHDAPDSDGQTASSLGSTASAASATSALSALRNPTLKGSPRSTPSASSPPSPPSEPSPERSSHFRKTYDDSVAKRAIPCDNCAMTLPRRKQASATSADDASPAPTAGNGTDARNPTLRTRVPFARVYDGAPNEAGSRYANPPLSVSSSSSDTDNDDRPSPEYYGEAKAGHHHHHRRTGTMNSAATSRSSASSAASCSTSHTHYFDYTSNHEPAAANAYSIIRASCLRTLTLETLPRSPVSTASGFAGSMAPLTPQPASLSSSYFAASPYSTATASAAAAAAASNGGPLFFGDPSTGYTTAHVFRVSDVHARGHKRVYALIALSTHRERLAMKAFGFVSAAFHELALWIQQLADAETERVADSAAASSRSGASSPAMSMYAAGYPYSQISPPPTQPSSVVNDSPVSQGSSFLSAAGNGLSRRMGPGYAGFGGLGSSAISSLRARGLPEILGKPDFFIELHARFVRLLLELSAVLNS